jgi:MFS superfamily sulfate permease-like transporter
VSWFRLDVTSGTVVAAVLLVVALGMRPFRRRWSAWVAAAAVETALVCALFVLWQLANRATHTHHDGGLSNGRAVWHLERWLHIPSETWLQGLILDHPTLVRASNYYYASAHLTGMLVFLVWLWLRHRDRYPNWRNIVVIFTGIALLIEMIPVAPPRLIGHTGLVDTAMVYGQSVYDYVGDIADQYAALPSIHVGWALLIGVATVSVSTSPWRWLGPAHAVLTMFVVVATANHYWFDGLTAAAVLAMAWGGQRLLAHVRKRLPRRRPLPQLVPLPPTQPQSAEAPSQADQWPQLTCTPELSRVTEPPGT